MSKIGEILGLLSRGEHVGSDRLHSAPTRAHFEVVSRQVATGWYAGSPTDTVESLLLDVGDWGRFPVSLGPERQDVKDRTGMHWVFSFVAALPSALSEWQRSQPDIQVSISLVEATSGAVLTRYVASPELKVRTSAGRIESLAGSTVSGWLAEIGSNDIATGRIRVLGTDISTPIKPMIERPDVAEVYLSDVKCGFVAALDLSSVDPASCILELSDSEGSVLHRFALNSLDSPRTSIAREGHLAKARRLAGLSQFRENPEWRLLADPELLIPQDTRLRTTVWAEGSLVSNRICQLWDPVETVSGSQGTLKSRLEEWMGRRFGSKFLLNDRTGEPILGEAARVLAILAECRQRISFAPVPAQVRALSVFNELVPLPIDGLPGATPLQIAYWRAFQGENPLSTHADYALLLTNWIEFCRPLLGMVQLITKDQWRWLAAPATHRRRTGSLHINRYAAARHEKNEMFLKRYRLESDEDVYAILCDVAVDEMFNGVGPVWCSNSTLGYQLFGQIESGIRTPGLLASLAWFSSKRHLVDGGTRSADDGDADEHDRSDFLAWFSGLPTKHPLILGMHMACGLADPHSTDRIDSRLESSPKGEKGGVSVVGLVGHGSGVGQNADFSAAALKRGGFSVQSAPVALDELPFVGTLNAIGIKFDRTALIHLQPDYIVGLFAGGQSAMRDTQKTIGFFAWEMSTIPMLFQLALPLVDEIWTPSSFCGDAFRSAFDGTVRVMPHAIDLDVAGVISRRSLGISDAAFVVHYSLDAHSSLARKNPTGALEAFARTFPEGDAVLLLRVRRLNHVFDMARGGDREANRFLSLLERPDVVLIDEELTHGEVLDLMNISDCYLSLHRSEGFGYTIAEAMGLGKPVVATNYGGNCDFMDASCAWPIAYQLVEVRPDEFPYWEHGQTWADPSVDDAMEALRIIRNGGEGVQHRARIAAARISETLTLDALATAYTSALEKR